MTLPSIVQYKVAEEALNQAYNVVLDDAPTEGNRLALFFFGRGSAAPSAITGGSWSQAAAGDAYDPTQYGGPGGTAYLAAYDKPVGAGHSATIGITPGGTYTKTLIVEIANAGGAPTVLEDEATLFPGSPFTVSAGVDEDALLIAAAALQRTTYAPADSITPGTGDTELLDAYVIGGAPHAWCAYDELSGGGTLAVGGTVASNPNLNKWGSYRIGLVYSGATVTIPVTRPVQVDIYSPEDVHLATLERASAKTFRFERNGRGFFSFRVTRHDPQSTETILARGNIVRGSFVQIHSGPLFEGVLEEGDFQLLSEEHHGGEELKFGGPGSLGILGRAILDYQEYTGGDAPNTAEGKWEWFTQEPGAILHRLIAEAQARGILSEVTETFTQDEDSDAVPWTPLGQWEAPIGANLYDEALRLVAAGDLQIEMRPGFNLDAWESPHGRDLTTSLLASGKVRFVKGINIVGALSRRMGGREYASRVVAIGTNGTYAEASDGAPPYQHEQSINVPSDDTDVLEAAAQASLNARGDAQQAISFAIRSPLLGQATDDLAGIYLPGPSWSDNGDFWLGDVISLHTGSNPFDFTNAEYPIHAITLYEDEAGQLAPPIVEVNAPIDDDSAPAGNASASSIATGGGTSTGTGPHSHPASGVSIADAGAYFDATTAEGALQELGADVAALAGGSTADAWDEAATNGAFAVRELTTASAGSLQRTAVYADGRTIFGYNRGDNGDACIRAFDHRTGVLGAEVVLKAALGPETHSVPEVLVLADGTILAAYSAHNGAALYLRISTSPNDIYGGFAAEVNLDSQLGGTAYTYPRLIQVADGTIYLFVRPVSGGSGQSWAYSTSTDGGATWSALTTYFSVASRWSYILCIARNGDSRIDFFGMDGSVANDANVDLGHFYLDTDAGTWHKSDGTSAGSLPLDNTDWTEVYDGTTNAAHTAAIAIEPHTGYPIVAFKVFQSDGTTDIRYRWGRWSGSAWSTAEVCTDGEWVSYQPGDVCLDTGRPNVVYASRQVAGVMQMWRYVTLDNATFTGEQLTSGVTDAVFPCSPDNRAPALPVLWAVGSWTDADTYAQGMSGYVAGDVTVGGTPATTVEAETSFGLSSAVGTDTEYARQDHTHGTPANPVTAAALVALGAVGPLLISDDHSTPIVFADLLLTEEGDDFLYADLGA